ncbi:stage V sporulation protein B [Clostridium thermosuccinogenes]|uniref:Multidrug-efflux transporter n=1 Tax=Clostridium thermosuccinogenes TaxID=84032 RepID=A0A2K2FMH7_9CLOT|nr:stage V sporulation protein B [Pseudoclostridium thermosuccinogenes]AUS95674.1 stage V sporulation protein B [Pseudoclostridium thermosuccinogenes]PNT93602.1 stage V sporulation protein B [Pseudoclostridium thermosuccinogenes]PNT99963.1 stage V sporulation protein B [Pseudoclostridium thermosuccinogenes]PNU01408.1 stage V sporulation protein B [Pseudoclostridium thermosuccinogenes]
MKIDRFYRNSLILILSNVFTGVIAFAFSIVLSRELGTEGLGLYGLVMPVYSLVLCLVSDGLVTALSRNTAVFHSKKDFKNLVRTVSTVFYIILMWAAFVGLVFFTGSSFIGRHLIKDIRSSPALKALTPALIFVPLSAIMKGFFYGIGKFRIPAFIDIAEKSIRIVVLLSIMALLPHSTIGSTVAAACSALAMGELLSFIILYSAYKIHKKKFPKSSFRAQNRLQLLANVLVISIPLCIEGVLSSILSTASSLILPRRLVSSGLPYSTALSLIGKFSGMSLTITTFPLIIISSVMTVTVPDLTVSASRKDYWALERRIVQVLKIASVVGISSLVVDMCIPDTLGKIFYNRKDLAGFIRFAAIPSFISYLSLPTLGILNGLGKQNVLLRNSLITSIQDVVLIYILTGIPSINIYGYGITLIISSLTLLILNFHEIRKNCDIKVSISGIVIYALIGILAFMIIRFIDDMMPETLPVLKALVIVPVAFFTVFTLSKYSGERPFRQA